MKDSLEQKIENGTVHVAVIGLGYTGLPLAVAFAKHGIVTTGIDIDQSKVLLAKRGISYIESVPDEDLKWCVKNYNLGLTHSFVRLPVADVVFVCVPTPSDGHDAPNLECIREACTEIANRMCPGCLVVLQSTVPPGTTEEFVRPILEQRSNLIAGQDFHLAFAPERIDPGNTRWKLRNTPRVVGGITPRCAELAALLLRKIVDDVQIVSSTRIAETTKLLENTFRMVNIALINELSLLCERMSVDVWEVIQAASTKPFGFMPFTPGAGVGGDCIPVVPHFLAHKAREYGLTARMIELAGDINRDMPQHVIELVECALAERNKSLGESCVLVLGVAFKPNVSDTRNSPGVRILELLRARGSYTLYHDSHVPSLCIGSNAILREKLALESIPLTENQVRTADCIVIATKHLNVDYADVIKHAALIVDCCNAVEDTRECGCLDEAGLAERDWQGKVVRLGAPPYQKEA